MCSCGVKCVLITFRIVHEGAIDVELHLVLIAMPCKSPPVTLIQRIFRDTAQQYWPCLESVLSFY